MRESTSVDRLVRDVYTLVSITNIIQLFIMSVSCVIQFNQIAFIYKKRQIITEVISGDFSYRPETPQLPKEETHKKPPF